ncbi:MAG: LPP20 family lipoprotein [Ignavibacteriales bacterium]|nr:LPP20 family lipoprotein [Ignavibacteriales bacterium]
MRILNRISSLSILTGLVLISLFGQERPDWARSLPNLPNKPESFQGLGIVYGTGNADNDWQRATGRARSDILSQIRVYVVSTSTNSMAEVMSGNQSQLRSAFESTTEQIAEGVLENLIIERWYDEANKVFYAYAAISRREVERGYEERLRTAVESAATLFASGRRATEEGNIALAIGEYLEASKLIMLAESYLKKTVVGDIDRDGREEPSLAFLQTQFCNLLGSIRMEIAGGNNQVAEKNAALPLPLTGKITAQTARGVVPVHSVSLQSSFVSPAQGSLPSQLRTDERGVFSIAVNEVTQGEATNAIRVGLLFEGLEMLGEQLKEVSRCWTGISADFRFTMRVRTNVKLALHVVEWNLGKPNPKSTVQEELQKRLIGERYTIVEESQIFRKIPAKELSRAVEGGNFDPVISAVSDIADFVVVGIVMTKERSNPTPGIFFTTGSVTIRVIDVKSGKIIASAALDNEREGGNSYEVAGMKILQRLGREVGEEIKASVDKALQ